VKRIGIICHVDPSVVRETLPLVLDRLASKFPDAKIIGQDGSTAPRDVVKSSDIIISIGGDGTMLLAARAIARANPSAKLIGINVGKLGFLSEHPPDEIDSLIDELADHTLVAEERLMLKAKVWSDSKENVTIKRDNLDAEREGQSAKEVTLDALNEVVIDNFGSTRMLTLEIFVGSALLGVIRADGIMISTPTGSTGYAVSAGGPIVEPSSAVMLITPIAPHSLNVRPIIVPESTVIRVRARMDADDRSSEHQVLVVADGQEQIVVNKPSEVRVSASPNRIHLLRRKERSYFDLLRSKLFWSADRRDRR
jgi:NAD+ kinase